MSIMKSYFWDKSKGEKAWLVASWLLKITFITLMIYSFAVGNYLNALRSLTGFIILIIPFLVEVLLKIPIPGFLDFMISLAVFLHQKGVIYEIYDLIPRYDVVLHYYSSFVISMLILITLYLFDKNTKEIKLTKEFVAISVIAFMAFFGVVWEISEFAIDLTFGTQTQPSLEDTMQDLILDLLAAITIAIIGYYYMAKNKFGKSLEKMDYGVKKLAKKWKI